MNKPQLRIQIEPGRYVDLFAEPDQMNGELLRDPIFQLKVVWGGKLQSHTWEQIFHASNEVFSVWSGLYWAVELFMEKREDLQLTKLQHLSSIHINPGRWDNKPLNFCNTVKDSVHTRIFSWDRMRSRKTISVAIRKFTEKKGKRHDYY